MENRLLTINEAAELLGRTPQAVYHLVARRQVPFRKNGRRLLFLENELRKFIESLPGVAIEEVWERAQRGGQV